MFASNHAWLIYIRVVQARVAARELPGQTVGGDVLERNLYIYLNRASLPCSPSLSRNAFF